MSDEIARLNQDIAEIADYAAVEIARLRADVEQRQLVLEAKNTELDRLRRVNEGLVKALDEIITWFHGGPPCNTETWIAKASAAIRSATEKGDYTEVASLHVSGTKEEWLAAMAKSATEKGEPT